MKRSHETARAWFPYNNTVGYYGSLRKALDALGGEIIRDKLRGGSRTLCEAVQAIREFTDEWRRLCEEVTAQ